MTGPDRADTRRMHSVSDSIEATHQAMENNTSDIVGRIGQLAQDIREEGMAAQLRRLAANLQEADRQIHQRIREIGQALGERATDIDTLVSQGQANLATTAQALDPGGKYGSALNG